MASMCQPGTNGVDGSMIGQAWRTNSPKAARARSASISSRREGLLSNEAKLFEFFIGKLGIIRFGCDLDRAARRGPCVHCSLHPCSRADSWRGRWRRRHCSAAARRNRCRRTETRPLAFARSMISPNFATLRRALDSALADAEESGDLFVGALHAVQLFEFGEIDLGFRTRHWSPPPSISRSSALQSESARHSPCEVGMPGADLRSRFPRSPGGIVRFMPRLPSVRF